MEKFLFTDISDSQKSREMRDFSQNLAHVGPFSLITLFSFGLTSLEFLTFGERTMLLRAFLKFLGSSSAPLRRDYIARCGSLGTIMGLLISLMFLELRVLPFLDTLLIFTEIVYLAILPL